jgi:hypothetical protein
MHRSLTCNKQLLIKIDSMTATIAHHTAASSDNVASFSSLRYRKKEAESYAYVDVPASSGGVFELEDLSADTVYTFSIMSINAVGKSEYVSDIGEIKTKSEFPTFQNSLIDLFGPILKLVLLLENWSKKFAEK